MEFSSCILFYSASENRTVNSDAQLEETLQSMKLRELIEYAVENEECCEQIGRILKSKFKIHEYLISMRSPRAVSSNRAAGMYLISDQHYYLTDMGWAMDLIRHFGGLITKLEYDWDNNRNPMLELIDHFCTNLIEVNFPIQWYRWLIGPFKMAKTVTISGELNKYLDLNRVYPSMEKLKMYSVTTSNASIIVQLYPNLKYLFSHMRYESDPLVEKVFKENPQIECLDIECENSIDILQSVSNSVQASNIKELHFHPSNEFYEKQIKPMSFNNVERFIVTTEDYSILPDLPFVFNRLEKFKYSDDYPLNNDVLRLPTDWYKIIPNNQNLKTISMPRTELSIQLLNEYSTRFPNLISFAFEMSDQLCNDALTQFLKSTQIKTIKIKRVLVENPCDLLTTELPTKWNYQFAPEIYTKRTQTLLLEQNSN